MTRLLALLCFALGLGLSPAARAENLAVIIANDNYEEYPSPSGAGKVLSVARPLQEAGFQVVVIRGMTVGMLSDELPDLARRMARADRLVLVTAGYYASVGEASWLVATDAVEPDIVTIGQQALAMASVYGLAEAKAGAVIVAVAEPDTDPRIGWRLARGFRPGDVPQGVTLLLGGAADIARHLPSFLTNSRSIGEVAADIPRREVRVIGFRPTSQSFLSAAPIPAPVPPDPISDEERLWQEAVSLNTPEAYLRYLRRYPNGRYADIAAARVEALDLTPEERAAEIEEALNLTRERRRNLQQYLTILGFDTKGIDGVFGPNTRAAIRLWQASIGAAQTGYLNGNQVARLEQAGRARAEELRRQEEEQRLAREAADRAFWIETGRGATEAGLRRYLDAYPDGLFRAEAERRLKEIEREKRRQAEIAEREAWDRAVIAGTVSSYREYLSVYPDGKFSAEARSRIRQLSGEPDVAPGIVDSARQREERMGLGPMRRSLIEQQLSNRGLDPGRVDGVFDDRTRAALRRFQQSNGLPPTGYVTEEVLLLLIAGALLPSR